MRKQACARLVLLALIPYLVLLLLADLPHTHFDQRGAVPPTLANVQYVSTLTQDGGQCTLCHWLAASTACNALDLPLHPVFVPAQKLCGDEPQLVVKPHRDLRNPRAPPISTLAIAC